MALVKFLNSKKQQNPRAFIIAIAEYWTAFYSLFGIAFFPIIRKTKFFMLIEKDFFILSASVEVNNSLQPKFI